MKLSLLELVLLFAGPLLLGAGVLRAVGITPRSDRLGYFGWAWLSGNLATALLVFVYYAIPIGARSSLVLESALLATAGALLFCFRRRQPVEPIAGPRGTKLEERVFLGFVIFVIVLVVLRILHGTLNPVLDNDEANFWALKAKVLFASGGFNAVFEQRMHAVYHADYPLLDPLLQVRVFLLAGDITHVANRLPIQVFALAETVIVLSALRRVVRPWIAVCLTLLLFACGNAREQAFDGGGDLIVGLGALAAFDAWLRWRSSGAAVWGRLAAIALGFMLWSKNEAFLYVLSILVAMFAVDLLRTRKLAWRRLVNPWLLVPVGVVVLHIGFNRAFGFVSSFSKHAEGTLLELFFAQFSATVVDVAGHFATHIVAAPAFSNWLLAAFAVLIVCFPRRITREPRVAVPAIASILAVLGLMAAFVASPAVASNNLGWHLHTAATRVVFQLVPCVTLWLGTAVSELDLRLAPGSS